MAKREFFIFITFSDTSTCTYNVCLLAIFADYHVHVPTQYMYMCVTIYDKYIFTFLGFKMSCLKDEVLVEPTIKLVDEYCLISTSDVIKVLNIISI